MSPVQKLQSRRTKTLLPTTSALLQPRVVTNVPEDIVYRRQKAKAYYDKGACPLPPLEIGDTVRLQPQDKGGFWSKATVVKKVAEHSYLVKTAQGHLLRRNRKFLRFTGEMPDEVTSQALLPTETLMKSHRYNPLQVMTTNQHKLKWSYLNKKRLHSQLLTRTALITIEVN